MEPQGSTHNQRILLIRILSLGWIVVEAVFELWIKNSAAPTAVAVAAAAEAAARGSLV